MCIFVHNVVEKITLLLQNDFLAEDVIEGSQHPSSHSFFQTRTKQGYQLDRERGGEGGRKGGWKGGREREIGAIIKLTVRIIT